MPKMKKEKFWHMLSQRLLFCIGCPAEKHCPGNNQIPTCTESLRKFYEEETEK
jgi:hypothetical protein